MSDDLFISYQPPGEDVEFRYWGGIYIEVGYLDHPNDWAPYDVINVWDPEQQASRIDTSSFVTVLTGVRDICDRWLRHRNLYIEDPTATKEET